MTSTICKICGKEVSKKNLARHQKTKKCVASIKKSLGRSALSTEPGVGKASRDGKNKGNAESAQALTMKGYRERLQESLGREAFLKQQRDYKRDYRKGLRTKKEKEPKKEEKKKGPVIVIKPKPKIKIVIKKKEKKEEKEFVDTDSEDEEEEKDEIAFAKKIKKRQIEALMKRAPSNISDGTKKKYINIMFAINKGVNDLLFIADVDFLQTQKSKVIRWISRLNMSDNTKRTYYNACMMLVKWLGLDAEEYEIFFKKLSDKVQTQDDKSVSKKKLPNWSEIVEIFDKLPDKHKKIVWPYVLFPPRRNKDYMLMKVEKTKDGEFNYLWKNKFTFNNYKTFGSYGKQEFKVQTPDYVPKSGWLLGKKYSQSNLSNAVKRILGYTINDLRHIYISENINKKDVTLGEKRKIAEKMAHSIGTQQEYIRIS